MSNKVENICIKLTSDASPGYEEWFHTIATSRVEKEVVHNFLKDIARGRTIEQGHDFNQELCRRVGDRFGSGFPSMLIASERNRDFETHTAVYPAVFFQIHITSNLKVQVWEHKAKPVTKTRTYEVVLEVNADSWFPSSIGIERVLERALHSERGYPVLTREDNLKVNSVKSLN